MIVEKLVVKRILRKDFSPGGLDKPDSSTGLPAFDFHRHSAERTRTLVDQENRLYLVVERIKIEIFRNSDDSAKGVIPQMFTDEPGQRCFGFVFEQLPGQHFVDDEFFFVGGSIAGKVPAGQQGNLINAEIIRIHKKSGGE